MVQSFTRFALDFEPLEHARRRNVRLIFADTSVQGSREQERRIRTNKTMQGRLAFALPVRGQLRVGTWAGPLTWFGDDRLESGGAPLSPDAHNVHDNRTELVTGNLAVRTEQSGGSVCEASAEERLKTLVAVVPELSDLVERSFGRWIMPEADALPTRDELTPEFVSGLKRFALLIRLEGIRPPRPLERFLNPELGPDLLADYVPDSAVQRVDAEVFESSRAIVLERTKADGLMALVSTPLAPEVAYALDADNRAFFARAERLAKCTADLQKSAKSGDATVKTSLDSLSTAKKSLSTQRAEVSATVAGRDLGQRNRTKEGAQRSAKNHRAAVALVEEWLATDSGNLDEKTVLEKISQLSDLLTEGIVLYNGQTGTAGKLRGADNPMYLDGQSLVPGEEVRGAMADFAHWFAAADAKVSAGEMNALELTARAMQLFLSIHPYPDGNGRTARLIMDWGLMRHGLPPATLLEHEIYQAHLLAQYNEHLDPTFNKAGEDAVLAVTRGVARTLAAQESALGL